MDFGLAVQVSWHTGALRVAGFQLPGPAATGLRAALDRRQWQLLF